jgi:hypothetical protein
MLYYFVSKEPQASSKDTSLFSFVAPGVGTNGWYGGTPSTGVLRVQ